MTTNLRHILSTGLLLSLGASRLAVAQEYFRELEAPKQVAPVVQLQPQEEDKYNLAVGPIRFNVAAGVGLEWNDNITLSDSHRESDFIFRPSLNIDATWRLTELNTLRFSLGASYAKYFDHSEFDTRGILLSPNSELAFTVHVGEIVITLRDRFSRQEDPFDLPVLSGVATYRRSENLVGVNAEWAINPSLDFSVGYNHYNLWTDQEQFDSLDRSIDTVYVRPALKITPAVTLGVNGSVNWVNFSNNIKNDGISYLAGAFIDLKLTENTHAYLEGGYQRFEFDSNGTILDSEDSDSFYIKSEIDNQLTDLFSQHLSFSKTTEVGFNSNFYELYHVEYGGDWKVTHDVSLDPTAFYEHYKTSGQDGERADRYGVAIGLRYVLTPSITMAADYRFILKDSNLPDFDYHQNSILLSLYYNF